eukprot:CAMPEP_0183786216 /NCGR_PEP_ID=MMETSP0739-20130205/66906_1 /TAXON_ID=385413 /ORGANISM="Thalassiosira miniscula, Strain CCMP1093" /LENGTH=421 /DNA_ID=CAMNT_0026030255 /DNA_START=87 /DNA_END=1353 /DNA_ORIENTATION=+
MAINYIPESEVAASSDNVFCKSFPNSSIMMCSQQQLDVNDSSSMPTAVPISPCSTEESSHSSAATPITGTFGHKYNVDPHVLGTGHYGSVRECIDRSTGQRYAVKSICKSDPSVKPAGLVREIRLLKSTKHQNIVHLVDVYEDAKYVHIVTDLCKGGELFDRIIEKASNGDNGSKCFAEDDAARVIRQVLEAVSYMHKRGIVHRDIKPENILYETKDEDSPLKVIDFGLARKHDSGLEPSMTTLVGTPYYIAPEFYEKNMTSHVICGLSVWSMTTLVGTPYYIAPEVLRKKYDKSCDLWSVGVVAYILLCGYPPFNGANNDETHRSVLRGQYNFPFEDWKGISPEARHFISQLLQMDSTKRMAVEEALNHPWIIRHTPTDAVMSDGICEEVKDKGSRLPRRFRFCSGPMAKRKVRKSMFGV